MNQHSDSTNGTQHAGQSRPTHDEIAQLAYQIYTEDGCLDGRDQEHWKAAEQQLLEIRAKKETDRIMHLGSD